MSFMSLLGKAIPAILAIAAAPATGGLSLGTLSGIEGIGTILGSGIAMAQDPSLQKAPGDQTNVLAGQMPHAPPVQQPVPGPSFAPGGAPSMGWPGGSPWGGGGAQGQMPLGIIPSMLQHPGIGGMGGLGALGQMFGR